MTDQPAPLRAARPAIPAGKKVRRARKHSTKPRAPFLHAHPVAVHKLKGS